MTWSGQVFAYCERGLDPAFWAEPLNATSNAAFLIAALLGLAAWAAAPGRALRRAELLLVGLAFAIAAGSFLFHTLATRWAALADVVPIGLFMAGYLAFALRRFLGLGRAATIAALAGFLALVALAGAVRCGGGACLNGSAAYLPALAALVAVGVLARRTGTPAGARLLAAAAIFAVSLVFRTADRALCPMTILAGGRALGTHALWHVCNGIVIHLLLQAAIAAPLSRPSPAAAPRAARS